MCSDATPPNPHQKYSGWIPTANGRLSFRHIGHADHPAETSYANVVDQHDRRFIASLQSRSLSDALFEPIVSRLFGTPGEFEFVLVASSAGPTSDSKSSISGKICIFVDPEQRTGKVSDIVDTISELRTERRCNRSLHATKFATLEEVLLAGTDIHIDFTLNRDGVVRFNAPQFKNSIMLGRSRSAAKLRGIDFEKWIADQAYFFLRDISHVHQHHDSATDTILILQETGSDDIEWRNKILFSLQFIVVAQRRLRDKQALARAKGLVAYSHAFRSVTLDAVPGARLVSLADDALLKSIDASLEELTLLHASEQDRRRAKRSLMLWAAAAVIAVLAIFVQPRLTLEEAEARPLLHMISVWAAANFLEVMITIGTLTIIGFVATSKLVSYGTRKATLLARLTKDVLTLGSFRPRIGWVLLIIGLATMGAVIHYAYLSPVLQAIGAQE